MGPQITYEPVYTIEPIYTGGSVNLSEDGRILAACLGEDVLLTDLESGRRLAKIEGDGDIITTLSLTPSASHLVACSRSLSMRIYALDRLSPENINVELLRTLKPHTSPVVTAAIDVTGSLLATGAADGMIKVWDIRGGYTTHTLHGHSGVISALNFFKVQDTKNSTALGDPHNRQKKRRISEQDEVSHAEAHGGLSDFRLASGDEDGKIRVWHLKKRKCIAVLDSHVSVVRGLDFSEQEQVLLSASRDKTAMLWDSSTWKLKRTIPILEEIEAAGFIRDYQGLFYTGGQHGKLRLWYTNGQEATKEQAPSSEGQGIVHVLYHVRQEFVLSVHADQNLVFNSLTSLDSQLGGKVEPLPIDRRISGTHDEIIDLTYVGRDANFLAVATNIEDLKILSLKSSGNAQSGNENYIGADVGTLRGHEDIIICMDVDWSGHWLATGAKDNTARLWRIDPQNETYGCHATLTGHAESLGAIALPKQRPPEGSHAHESPLQHPPVSILTGSQDKTIKRWDTRGSQPVGGGARIPRAFYTRKAHDKDINALDINHDSSLFLSASQDRTVKIWSFEDGEAIGILRGHRRGVWTAKFAPPSTTSISTSGAGQGSGVKGYVLTGSGDKTVKIWSVSDFSCLRTFEGHTNSVLKVLWMNSVSEAPISGKDGSESKKGRNADTQVASAGSDGLVKIWDVSSSECACTLDNHTDRVWALALNPNPQTSKATSKIDVGTHTLISGSADATLTLWMNTTVQTTHAVSVAESKRVEQDQALQNYIRSRSYRPAILLALKLNHPARLLALFSEVRKTWPKEEGSMIGVKEVDDVLAALNEEELLALLGRCKEWNANTKTAPVAQSILWTLLRSHPAAKFTNTKVQGHDASLGSMSGKRAGMKETLDALRVYTERHYKRMEELVDESFLVDYTLREMDEVIGTSALTSVNGAGANGINRNVNGSNREEDEMMIG